MFVESRGTLEFVHDRVPNGAAGFYLLGLICKCVHCPLFCLPVFKGNRIEDITP